jgi:multidrug efflux pump subunit AcrB
MNLVSAALRRPVTVFVLLVATCLAGWLGVQRMRVDLLPDLGTPVVYVAQPYGGMDPGQMEAFLTSYYEYHFLYITGIEHVESRSIQGVALIKLFFHPGTNMAQALAETIAQVNRSRAFMPPGTVSPFVVRFDAGSVAVGNLVFSSESRSLGEMQDLALFKVRPLFSTLPGVSAPPPFGGQQRTMVVRVDPEKLRAYNMAPDEVVRAIATANTISPSGAIRIGRRMPVVPMNSLVSAIKELEGLPLRAGGNPVFLRDVGDTRDSSDIPSGYALVNGRRTVYIPVAKRADASTLSVVEEVKRNLSRFQALVPEDIRITYEFDHSGYVTQAMGGLALEGLLGAVLTGITVLLFLRDARSALVVVLNIPLALLAAAAGLWLSGMTLNVMTLGGLALAVGVLVDEATVSIENIHVHLAQRKPLARAVLDASHETQFPRLLAMLCVLAVFIPSFFMAGVARALFQPLALAVGFSMAASYLLSSTFVPVLATWILGSAHHADGNGGGLVFQHRYQQFLERLLGGKWLVVAGYGVVVALLLWCGAGALGTEIFPRVDAGLLRMRLRAPTGTRIEVTEEYLLRTLDAVKAVTGEGNVAASLAFVGVQASSYPVNTIHLWTSGPEEAVVQIQLRPGSGHPLEALQERLRTRLAEAMPELRLSFEPADLIGQVMSFGSPTPIEVAVSGPKLADDREHAEKIRAALAGIPSLRDLQYGQVLDYPAVSVTLDRERAAMLGLTAQDVARSVVAATSSSRFTEPNYWRDPNSGVAYQVQVQIPTDRMDSLDQIRDLPLTRGGDSQVLLRNVADVAGSTVLGEYDRYNMQRMVTLTANVHGEDLGRVGRRVERAVAAAGKPPKGVTVTIRGQLAPLSKLQENLTAGLWASVVVIFLLLAANFQSVRLALVTVSTLPAVLAGVVLALIATGTTLNLQSFMGAIMAMGVAVANAILLVTFAERSRREGQGVLAAAVGGGGGRVRPILMTSAAMVAGMLPMACAFGEGGQQSAPLGRAVIGGLILGTLATLFVLPAVFAAVQGRAGTRSASLHPDDPDSAHFRPV